MGRWDRSGRDKRICSICGREIIGECDFNITQRKTMVYFHKGAKCPDKNVHIKKWGDVHENFIELSRK